MSRQVKRDTEALLTSLDVLSVELVALLNRAESGVLADGPWTLGVHRRVRPASKRKLSRKLFDEVGGVKFGVQRFDVNTLKSLAAYKRTANLVYKMFSWM